MDYVEEEKRKLNYTINNMSKVVNYFKRIYEKLRLEKVAIASVIVTQALKRLVQSEFTLLVLELAPLPWVNFLSKIIGYINKANEVVPLIVKQIVVTKGILDTADVDDKLALNVLVDHLRYYNKEELGEFLQYFSLMIMNADDNGDGVVSDEERAKIIQDTYTRLFKDKK